DHPLREWTPEIDTWLAEMLRLEGRCGHSDMDCAGCSSDHSPFRCRDCSDVQMYCESCMVHRHRALPFHRLERWHDGIFFAKVDLKSLGLRIQLGHPPGVSCINPERAFGDDFVVLDLSGVHSVGLDFCGCTCAASHTVQLLRARLFPATSTNPKTAATFALLRHFHLLSNQANVSGFEFHTTLARLTDNTGVNPPKDRYPSFMRMMRMWRNLQMFKRAGRGHDPAGVNATAPGECAVACPACPHPGKNLPEDWQNAPPDQQWLYRLFVGIDANFRLKRRLVSSNEHDPGLNRGAAYFVEERAYKAHLAAHSDLVQETTSTCHNHDAVKLANSRGQDTTDATGVVTIECTRHDMKRPCSVGDLQKGERYVNTDYVFHSSVQDNDHLYNPQWDFAGRRIIFLIPKFHLPAHKVSCRENYSFNYAKHVGRTDGEAVERGWSAVNGFSGSTREMGPGARRDLLDDVFADYNWRKIARLPTAILNKVKVAIDKRSKYVFAFEALDDGMNPAHKMDWQRQVETWESGTDGTCPNPFAVTRRPVTLAAVRLKLAERESAELQARSSTSLLDVISPYSLISQGLDHEEEQRRLKAKKANLGSRATDLQKGDVVIARNSLFRTIEAWQAVQHLYMPTVAAQRSRDTALNIAPPAEDISLYLPSEVVDLMTVEGQLQDIEWELRVGLAHDALEDIRRLLSAKKKLLQFKSSFVTGQYHNTRARGAIDRCMEKITQIRAKYNACYSALTKLAPALGKTSWRRETGLQQLVDNDVRYMSEPDPEAEDEQTEGTRTVSWIWTTKGAQSGDDDEDEEEST
ncbi:uncharacterized protein B0H18DRAFT_883995, partial [Fomitopsis serialis]|uniref:uncharacterized protein n=1 Tax=Fomitopsis serialis TaxID=139415 RepID=UPI00200780AA